MKIYNKHDKTLFLAWYYFLTCLQNKMMLLYILIIFGFGSLLTVFSFLQYLLPNQSKLFLYISSSASMILFGSSLTLISATPCIISSLRGKYFTSEDGYRKAFPILLMLILLGIIFMSHGIYTLVKSIMTF